MRPKSSTLKQKIIDAATTLILTVGVAGTSTVKVARRIHSSQSNLYSYFKSKQELLLAVFEYHETLMTTALAPTLAHDLTSAEQINASMKALIAFSEQHPQSIQIIAAFRAQPDLRAQLPTVAENDVFMRLFTIIRRYQDAGLIKPLPIDFLAEGIFALVVNYVTAILANEPYAGKLTAADVAQLATDLIWVHRA